MLQSCRVSKSSLQFHKNIDIHYSSSVSTVEPRYVELGYLELSAISNRIGFPWICSCLVYSVIYYGLSRTRLFWTPHYLELFLAPLSSNQPRTSIWSEETLVNISQDVQSWHLLTRCSESWETYWHVHGNKSRLTGLAAANAEGDKLPVFDNFGDQFITPEIWREPRYLEPPLSWTISRYPWEFEIAGFYSHVCRLTDSSAVLCRQCAGHATLT